MAQWRGWYSIALAYGRTWRYRGMAERIDPMPLDRPITVGVRGADNYNDAGQFVPGVAVEYPVWATAIDISVQRVLEAGGARLDSDRVFRVRWFSELALAPVAHPRW